MDWQDPTVSVVPSLDGAVLVALAATSEWLTGREVQRRVRRGGVVGVRNVLMRLVEQGVVHMQVAGTANLFRLNRDHIAAPVAAALLDLRSEFIHRLRDSLAHWEIRPVAAALFGSVARGDGTVSSDVDLLIVRPGSVSEDDEQWGDQITRLYDSVRSWTGNSGSILQATEADVGVMIRRDAPVRQSLLEDAIDLAGRPLRELLGPKAG